MNENFSNSLNKQNNYKRKRKPILSFGLIPYHFDDKGDLYILFYKRRDNFEYMDFMRGAWDTRAHLNSLFALMSQDERDRLRNYKFEDLWNDLWVSHKSNIYKEGHSKAKKKFESVKPKLKELIESNISTVSDTPWEFPKGRKNNKEEDPISCASREFSEETNLSLSVIERICPIPIIENFKGTNNKTYETIYYAAKISTKEIPDKIETPQCIRKDTISEEASEIRWFRYTESLGILDERRRKLLESTKKFMI